MIEWKYLYGGGLRKVGKTSDRKNHISFFNNMEIYSMDWTKKQRSIGKT
ncbi:hypothetical protein MSIBF_A2700007 [groundwater metagenome]|uniref:Uncharacterized protein n=1 Tax=groundwater metagenome TaxID=717931 RepID=A0A098EBA6_9ZZZZ